MSSLITSTITISRVHPGPTGGAVFTGQDQSGRWVRAVASRGRISRTPVRGEVWQLTGQFFTHAVYGRQFHVELSSLRSPVGQLLVRYLTTHPSFRGLALGRAKTARLYKEFGERLASLLDEGSVDELARVVNKEVAEKLLAAWYEHRSESNLIAFLDEHGVDARLAAKIIHCWPERAIEKLRENPYRLLVMTGWSTVDRLAMSLGVSPNDKRRLIAAAEAAVYDRLDLAKDTLTNRTTLRSLITRMLKAPDPETPDRSIELAVSDGAIAGHAVVGYQPVGCRVMEQHLVERFREMASHREQTQPSLFGRPAVESEIDTSIETFEREEGIRLNAEQRAAVAMAVTEPLSILTGGAGVGKTTVLKAVHRVLESTSLNVIQMALAGRAAQRMRETTAREAYTITAFLNRVRTGQLKLGRGDLLIIDESSMLDLMLVYRIVRAMPKGIRLLLVGDPHQLPPIGPGLVFHLMARSSSVPVQELLEVHRQAESTGIPRIGCEVKSGDVPELLRFDGLRSGVTFLECLPHSIIGNLMDVVNCLGGYEDTQVLGVTKNGAAGVKTINLVFHQKLTSTRRKLHEWEIAESEPVIYTVNDYDRELYNGSLGRVDEICPDSERREDADEEPVRVVCDFDGRRIGLSDAEVCNLELAYAITTHKAQGSQFKRVVIPVTKSRLLDRTLIYTALTRGIEQVVFLGDRQAFDKAITNPPSVTLRNVGFAI